MRIQNKNFLLTITVEHTGHTNSMVIDAYGEDFNPLPVQRKFNNLQETIEFSTYLPNKVMLILSGKNYQTDQEKSIKLLSMSLAGIKINNDILLNLVDYRPNPMSAEPNSIAEYLDNKSTDPSMWDRNGCVLFNLFATDPFAYLLYIGNKIRF